MPLCSLNEHWSASYKAARAAGLDWGLAEETARGCMILAAHRLPFMLPLVLNARRRRLLCAPSEDGIMCGVLRAPSGFALCPLWCGALLADCASSFPLPWRLQNVAVPLLLVPFMQRAARYIKPSNKSGCLKLSWQGAMVYVDSQNIWRGGVANNLSAQRTDVRISLSAIPRFAPLPEQAGSAKIATSDWREMQRLAAKTFVPATAQSRQGAGAGEVDND